MTPKKYWLDILHIQQLLGFFGETPAGATKEIQSRHAMASFIIVQHFTTIPFVSHEIDKHAVLQIHTEASKPY
jgi:hypothetical protein